MIIYLIKYTSNIIGINFITIKYKACRVILHPQFTLSLIE